MSKLAFRKGLVFGVFCISFFTSLSTAIADENTFGYRVFEIQKKYALKGITLAQYKLGTFYEYGISVKPNPPEAIIWYKKAAKKHNKLAINRLHYLDVKLNGYNNSHSQWINQIKNESENGNIHSTIILGQLNHYGLGLKKNLPSALKLLRKASANGHTEIDFEIDEIQNKMSRSQTKSKPKPEAVSQPVKQKTKPEVKIAAKKTKSKQKKVTHKKTSLKMTQDEKKALKRKKYEDAMRKQFREQLILQQQQEWSEVED